MRATTLLLTAIFAAGCGDDDGGGGGADAAAASEADAAGGSVDAVGAADAPGGGGPDLRATGTASAGEEAGDRVECSFLLDIDQVAFGDDGGWTGFGSGEVFRVIFVGEMRYEFSAFVAGEVSLAVVGDGVEARLVGDQPDDAKPFWLDLEVIAGAPTGERSWGGAWICAPILLGDPGFPDLDLEAVGTWMIGPAE